MAQAHPALQGTMVGDRLRIPSGNRQLEGRLMPSHAFSAPDHVILKLDSGYNVGIHLDAKAKVERLAGAETAARAAADVPNGKGPKVAVLGTGGTIASFVDYRTGAVHPAATAKELAYATPELFDHVSVDAKVVFQVFSEDLAPADWLVLAEHVEKAFAEGAQGVVIPHGTDTLGYTAAALAFQLQDLPGPVVLVGAQRSSDRPSSDAASNLLAAARLAGYADLGEVVVVMHAGADDDSLAIHRGVRVRKNHTSRRDAFASINQAPLGSIHGDEIRLDAEHRPRARKGPRRVAGWEPNVGYLWSYPGMDGDAITRNLGKGLVIAGTGLGHVPRRCLDAVEQATNKGAIVAITSQCLWGRTNLRVYSTGRDLLKRGVVEAHDMLPETAFVKLQHALGVAKDRDEAIRIFQTDVAGETAATTEFATTAQPTTA